MPDQAPRPSPTKDDSYSDQEAARRRDEALRRALSTPYKPQDALKKGDAKPDKRTTGKGRARVEKGRR